MREILQIGIGQCGTAISYTFWEQIAREHGIQPDGSADHQIDLKLEKSDVFFRENKNGKYVPRAIMADLDKEGINKISFEEYSTMFSLDQLISFKSGSCNNWAVGHYTDGAEFIENVIEQCRKEIETCECFQGIQSTLSISGGTGSGFGSLLNSKLRDAYPERIQSQYVNFPHPSVKLYSQIFDNQMPESTLSPYNAILSIHQLIENLELVYLSDNFQLAKLCERKMILEKPTFSHYNKFISQLMCIQTSSIRFPGTITADFRKQAVNLISFPRLHFLQSSLSQFEIQLQKNFSVSNHLEQLHLSENLLASGQLTVQNDINIATTFVQARGSNISTEEVEMGLVQIKNQNPKNYIQWIENSFFSSICRVSPTENSEFSATFNTHQIRNYFTLLTQAFTSMFRRKAFLHLYTGQGMDEMEFIEAESNLNDLISEYIPYSGPSEYIDDPEFAG